jgi:hypothetical protein
MTERSRSENIEYYLGKDTHVDMFFNSAELLSAYDIFNDGRLSNYDQTRSTDFNVYFNWGMPDQRPGVVKLNNCGFRNDFDFNIDELNRQRVILCLGCSDTMAPNLTDDALWVNIMRKQLPEDVVVLNLGLMSAAPDTITRLIVNYTTLIRSTTDVCVIWPNVARREVANKNFCKLFTARTPREFWQYEDKTKYLDYVSNSYNFHKNKIMCEALAHKNRFVLHDVYVNRSDPRYNFDVASGLGAYGPESNIAFANYFYKKIMNYPSLFDETGGAK